MNISPAFCFFQAPDDQWNAGWALMMFQHGQSSHLINGEKKCNLCLLDRRKSYKWRQKIFFDAISCSASLSFLFFSLCYRKQITFLNIRSCNALLAINTLVWLYSSFKPFMKPVKPVKMAGMYFCLFLCHSPVLYNFPISTGQAEVLLTPFSRIVIPLKNSALTFHTWNS